MLDAKCVEVWVDAFDQASPSRVVKFASVEGCIFFLHVLVDFAIFTDSVVGRNHGCRIIEPSVGSSKRTTHDVNYNGFWLVNLTTGLEVCFGCTYPFYH